LGVTEIISDVNAIWKVNFRINRLERLTKGGES